MYVRWPSGQNRSHLASHRPLGRVKYQYQYPYRTGIERREIEFKELKKMTAAQFTDWAPLHESEWAKIFFLVAKERGYVRFCVDYH